MDNMSSLIEAVKQVTEQQKIQAAEMKRRRQILSQLHTDLCEFETELKSVLMETKEVEKKISQEDDLIENIMYQCGVLETQNLSIYTEIIKLKQDLENQNEEFEAIVLGNNRYRERFAEAIHRFSVVENELPVMIELIKKRDMVRFLKSRKEEIILDSQNPGSSAMKQVQDEISNINNEIEAIKQSKNEKEKIYNKEIESHARLRTEIEDEISNINNEIEAIKQSKNEKEKIYNKEIESHARLRTEIEVQKKRCDAILKRLHSQLNKAQLNTRQYQWNIAQMENTAADLRKNLGITK